MNQHERIEKPRSGVRSRPEGLPDPPGVSPRGPARPHEALVTAWLLLLLAGRETYGYQLRRELDANSLHMDASAVYRALRKLEGDEYLTSRWMKSRLGPQRRSYRLTGKGRRRLDEITALITSIRDAYDAYLGAHRRSR